MKQSRKFLGYSLSLLLVNLAAILERADENLLPAVYKEVSEAFDVGPSDLGYLTFSRKLIQGLTSPVAGVLVLQYDRPVVLAIGTVFWALSTAAVGVSQRFSQVVFWRAVNGIGLAIVIPALQSFIADSYVETGRGKGFGMLSLVGTLGGVGGGVFATVMAGHEFFGIPGWRFAFLLMAAVSTAIGFLIFMFVEDPRRRVVDNTDDGSSNRNVVNYKMGRKTDNWASIWKESWVATKAVIKVPTFQVIVMQGLVGSLPWTSMVFFTMWFQLIGFDHNGSAALMSVFKTGAAIGSLCGGLIGDKVSSLHPYSGRIMVAQFSAFMGIPFTWFLLTVIPQDVGYWATFSTTLLLMGLIISWNNTATNSPMFAEVVPAKHRTMIYAFDRTFEGSFSSFAAPLVGILSERIYGYDPKSVRPGSGSAQEAYALSRGLLTMMAVPFGLCSLLYSPLYFIFKKDRESARTASLKEEEDDIELLGSS